MKILVITSRVPYPLEKGDKLRIYNQVKFLAEKHEVILCAVSVGEVDEDAIVELKKYCTEFYVLKISKWQMAIHLFFNFFTKKPFQIAYFFNSNRRDELKEIIQFHRPEILYCHLIRVAEYVKGYAIPKVIDYMDAFSKGMERRIAQQSIFSKWVFKMEFKRLQNYEQEIFSNFNAHTIISSQDRDFINHPNNQSIQIIPNGIDTIYFKPEATTKKYDLLFTGNMSYPPNVETALYIAKEILPLLINEFPNIKLMIAGANPTSSIKALVSENILVSGWVDDLRTLYNESAIFLAPMQIGTGIQNKLLEAMAMNMPCIASELANSSLLAKKDVEILIGTNANEYADLVKLLINDEQKSATLANNGQQFIITNYGWDQSNLKFEKLLQNTLAKN